MLGPGTVERDQAAAGVGLQVVVISHLQLPTPDKGVAAADHGHLWGQIPLGIVVVNRTLPLAAGYVRVVDGEAGRERRALGVRDKAVIGRRPALLGHVESRVDGQTKVM